MASKRPKSKIGNKIGGFSNPLRIQKTNIRKLPKSSTSLGRGVKIEKPLTFWQKLNPFRKRKIKLTWKNVLIGLGVAFCVMIICIAGVFAYFVRDLKSPKELSKLQIEQSTKILDRSGNEIYSFHGEENRTVVNGDQISDNVKNATIAVEDANFYNHHGFDLKGISRAALSKITGSGMGGGGSTITQQYIKNTLLTSEETYTRKIKELILSIEVEQTYTKDEILTGYLNQIPYGNSAYGIESAAKTYFNKSAKDLNLSEAATLASIPQLPTYYSPYGNHLDKLFERKNYVLDRMVEVGSITSEEAEKAKLEAPSADNPSFSKRGDLVAAHFVFYVREQLINFINPEDPQLAEQELDKAGYTVTTSLDMEAQKLAESTLATLGPDMVKKYKATNACLTAVDPKTGEVIAMAGSIDYEDSKSGNTNFCNANLQPGSSFKPIVYATAFGPKFNYSPSSITYDLKTDFGNYIPNNYNGKFNGPITNRQALAGSLNIPAVKNLALVGVEEAINTARSMGINTLNRSAENYGLSLVLGSGEVKPVEMAAAYSVFANGGMKNKIRPILKIEQNGQVVKDFTSDPAEKVLEPEVAFEINSILSDNNARSYVFGTKNNLILPDRPVAAKSGTTENNRDAWTIGFTPQIATAVWVGNNDPNKTMVKGADGSYVAAPIWNRFMKDYLTGKPVEQFTRPSTVIDFTVDKLSGKKPTDQSPPDQRITDIFAPWQLPKDNDDVHVKFKIDRVSGKLATSLTPASDIIEQYFFSVKSERPDNPNWEGPVQAWAIANGGGVKPPTESDDVHTEANIPSISITSPSNNSVLIGDTTFTAIPGGTQGITQVEFYINDNSIGIATASPYSTTYNVSNLASGTHTFKAVVTNSLNLTNSATANFSTVTDITAPLNAENISAIYKGATTASISWTNPSNSDVSLVNIYLSTTADASDLGTKIGSKIATPNSNDGMEITLPASGKTYYVIVRPQDTTGNENVSTKKTLIK